jgi:hypothetical protein
VGREKTRPGKGKWRKDSKEGSKMFGKARKCSEMFGNVRKCSEMFGNVWECSSISGNVKKGLPGDQGDLRELDTYRRSEINGGWLFLDQRDTTQPCH